MERLVPNKSKYDYLAEDKFFKIVGAKRCPNVRNPLNVSLRFKCLKCQALLSTSDHSIGNLKKHIERLHPQFVNEFANSRKKHRSGDEEKALQIAMTDLEDLKTKKAVMSKHLISQSQLDEAIVNFVVKDCQTYEVVKRRGGFHDLLEILAPGRKVMSRRTLTRRIQDDFKALKRQMKNVFADQEYIAISVDGWSKNSKSFMGYTATFLDAETLERTVIALACRRIMGSHTWDVCAENIEDVLNEFNILNSTKMCTTDGASNFQKCFVMCGTQTLFETQTQQQDEDDEDEELDLEIVGDTDDEDDDEAAVRDDPDIEAFNIGELFDQAIEKGELDDQRLPFRIRCQAHNLNLLATTDAKKADTHQRYSKISSSFMAKVKKLWKAQSKSTLKAEVIEEHVGGRLKIPGATRWNSMYDALASLKEKMDQKKSTFQELLQEIGERKFTNDELTWHKEWLRLNRPIAHCLDKIQADVGLGHALPLIVFCKKQLKKVVEDDERPLEVCKPLGKALLDGVKKRFDAYFDLNEWILASVSTPQFKLSWLTDELAYKKEEAKKLLLDEVRKVYNEKLQSTSGAETSTDFNSQRSTSNGPSKTTPDEDDFDTFFDTEESKGEEKEDYCETLVQSYLQAAGPNQKELSLLQNYPEIRTIYRKFNIGTPSSAPVERFFSQCGRVFRNDRSRLTDRNFEAHALLHANKAKVTHLYNRLMEKDGPPVPKKSK